MITFCDRLKGYQGIKNSQQKVRDCSSERFTFFYLCADVSGYMIEYSVRFRQTSLIALDLASHTISMAAYGRAARQSTFPVTEAKSCEKPKKQSHNCLRNSIGNTGVVVLEVGLCHQTTL